jgi:hypothetical protein
MAFGCLPLAGQEKAVMKTGAGEYVPMQGMQLRAGGAMPDSMITYAATGEKSSRTVFTYNTDGKIAQEEIFNWENSRWVNTLKRVYEYDNPPESKMVPVAGLITEYTWESGQWVRNPGSKSVWAVIDGIIYINNWICWPSPVRYYGSAAFVSSDGWSYRAVSVNDSKGNPVSVEFHVYQIANPDNSSLAFRFVISYNDRSQPVSVKGYQENGNGSMLIRSADYQYDSEGNTVFFEELDFDNSGDVYSHIKYTSANGVITEEQDQTRTVSKTDSDGNIYLRQYFTSTGGKMYMTHYDIYYPNDLTPSVTPGDSPPVDDTNRGKFDVIINLPTDSIADGSFVIKLPDGYTLDETGTRLSVDFGDFALVITKQEDNSWLLEVRPKGTRSAALRSEDVSRVLAHIAYTVDGTVKRGTYDITVHSIQFETPGGDAIVGPALTVPVRLNRWGAGSEAIAAADVWSAGSSLHIRTPQSAALYAYTVAGVRYKQQMLPAGETVITLPQRTYFVQTGETVKKVLIR